MTNPFLNAFDEAAHADFVAEGMADVGQYLAPGSDTPIPCRCFVTRGIQSVGEYGQLTAPRTVLQLLRADVSAPRSGGTVTIGAEVFTLDAQDAAGINDESIVSYVVAP